MSDGFEVETSGEAQAGGGEVIGDVVAAQQRRLDTDIFVLIAKREGCAGDVD